MPTITTLSPSLALVGAPFTLAVNGTNFVSGSVVNWNGSPRTTAVVSARQLTAAIPATDVAAIGMATITVFNPAPGGGTSPALAFTVSAGGYALRFHGNGVNDIDRVKIQLDDPTTSNPDPPANVGATDFTLEFWMKGSTSENLAGLVQCGANNNWIFGNIIIDRDRFSQGLKFGLSVGGGRLAFGVTGTITSSLTICGNTNVLDSQWHHVAVQRRLSDGQMWLYVDGALDAQGTGPLGDISYPFHAVPGNFCGWISSLPCVNDPFLVIGAEKHDAGSQFPSFSGWMDEVRMSNMLRYLVNFTRPSLPFPSDVNTVALYHFDEGQGNIITDSSGATGGPSPGVRNFGGSPAGPEWVTDTPFGNPPSPPTISISSPPSGATVSGITTLATAVSSNAAGVQFRLDGANLASEVTTPPFSLAWDTRTALNGCHTLSGRVRDASGTQVFSAPVPVAVANGASTPGGLVAAYSFNEGSGKMVADASCNGNVGTINGAAWTTSGRFGNALSFDATSNWVTALDSASLHLTTAMTLEAWVYPTVSPFGWRALLDKEQTGDVTYWLYASNSSGNAPLTGVFIGTEQNMFGGSQLAVNTWTHLATTYDGAMLRLYVNGVQVASRAQTGSISVSSGSLRIGGDNIWGEFFQGRVDEVRIYNRALSPAEIQTDMNTPILP